MAEFYAGRGIDPEQSYQRMKTLMDAEGLPYGRRTHTYNSRLAQEFGKWADTQPGGEAIHDRLYKAYFVDAKNLADVDLLVDIAASVGLPADEARAVLDERRFKRCGRRRLGEVAPLRRDRGSDLCRRALRRRRGAALRGAGAAHARSRRARGGPSGTAARREAGAATPQDAGCRGACRSRHSVDLSLSGACLMTASMTDETEALFAVLRQSADGETVAAIERFVAEAPDRALCRINPIAFAARHHLDEERVIGAFLHAARLGIFELSWNVLCPGCGGVLEASATLKSVHSRGVCLRAGAPPATSRRSTRWSRSRSRSAGGFAGSPATSRTNCRFSNTSGRSSGLRGWTCRTIWKRSARNSRSTRWNCRPARRRSCRCSCRPKFLIVMEPVTHAAQFIEVKGEPTRERQSLAMIFNDVIAPTGTIELRPGPLRLSLENRTRRRLLPAVWIAGDALHDLMARRRPFLTAKRLVDQPDLPRHLSHRHARCRSAAQDHQPDLSVHRPQRLDRAVQQGRRPGRLRPGAGAFPAC